MLKYEKDHTPGHLKMYQWAIDNEIEEVVCELAGIITDSANCSPWKLYKNVEDVSLELYNKEHGTSYSRDKDYRIYYELPLERYSNEPRIGGYPDKIIHSYDEMIKFMEEGHTDEEGKKFEFYYQEERKERFMNGIKTFFEKHPDGIITFG